MNATSPTTTAGLAPKPSSSCVGDETRRDGRSSPPSFLQPIASFVNEDPTNLLLHLKEESNMKQKNSLKKFEKIKEVTKRDEEEETKKDGMMMRKKKENDDEASYIVDGPTTTVSRTLSSLRGKKKPVSSFLSSSHPTPSSTLKKTTTTNMSTTTADATSSTTTTSPKNEETTTTPTIKTSSSTPVVGPPPTRDRPLNEETNESSNKRVNLDQQRDDKPSTAYTSSVDDEDDDDEEEDDEEEDPSVKQEEEEDASKTPQQDEGGGRRVGSEETVSGQDEGDDSNKNNNGKRQHPIIIRQPRPVRHVHRWSEEEDRRLRAAVQENQGQSWKYIATLVPGRDHTQCLQRWSKCLAPGLRKGTWFPEEDDVLRKYVEEHLRLQVEAGEAPSAKNLQWCVVSRGIAGRTAKQCRERWVNNLNPEINRGSWTPEEDAEIIRLHNEMGPKWAQIAKHMVNRTENGVKIRWKSLCRTLSNTQPHLVIDAPGAPPMESSTKSNKSYSSNGGETTAKTSRSQAAQRRAANAQQHHQQQQQQQLQQQQQQQQHVMAHQQEMFRQFAHQQQQQQAYMMQQQQQSRPGMATNANQNPYGMFPGPPPPSSNQAPPRFVPGPMYPPGMTPSFGFNPNGYYPNDGNMHGMMGMPSQTPGSGGGGWSNISIPMNHPLGNGGDQQQQQFLHQQQQQQKLQVESQHDASVSAPGIAASLRKPLGDELSVISKSSNQSGGGLNGGILSTFGGSSMNNNNGKTMLANVPSGSIVGSLSSWGQKDPTGLSMMGETSSATGGMGQQQRFLGFDHTDMNNNNNGLGSNYGLAYSPMQYPLHPGQLPATMLGGGGGGRSVLSTGSAGSTQSHVLHNAGTRDQLGSSSLASFPYSASSFTGYNPFAASYNNNAAANNNNNERLMGTELMSMSTTQQRP